MGPQPEPLLPSVPLRVLTPEPDADASRYEPAAVDPDASCYQMPAGFASDTPTGATSSANRRGLPRRLGDYELLAEIARGGMGIVYRARQLKAGGRRVALKMMLSGDTASPQVLERFRREASAVAGLDHPGIVPVYEVGEVEGHPFYSMALVEGGSLQQLLQRQGPLEPREAVRLVRQVAEAVQHAHDGGVIHRDIKPHNILLASAGRQTASGGAPSVLPVPDGLPPPPAPSGAGAMPRLADFGLANPRGWPLRHRRSTRHAQLHGPGTGRGPGA